jgi:hypothetical protein
MDVQTPYYIAPSMTRAYNEIKICTKDPLNWQYWAVVSVTIEFEDGSTKSINNVSAGKSPRNEYETKEFVLDCVKHKAMTVVAMAYPMMTAYVSAKFISSVIL